MCTYILSTRTRIVGPGVRRVGGGTYPFATRLFVRKKPGPITVAIFSAAPLRPAWVEQRLSDLDPNENAGEYLKQIEDDANRGSAWSQYFTGTDVYTIVPTAVGTSHFQCTKCPTVMATQI
jgi:hypothetical protein